MRQLSHRYGDLISETYADLDGINQVLGLKALAGGNRGGAYTDYGDGVSFRKNNISTDGFGFGRIPFSPNSFFGPQGRGLGLFQFYDTPMDFCTVFAQQGGGGNNPPLVTKTIDAYAMNGFSNSNIEYETAQPLPELISHTSLNGYDIIADGVEFLRIAGGTRRKANVIQQPLAPAVVPVSPINYGQFYDWGSWGTGAGQFTNPHGITVDSNGNVYVVDDTHRIQVFNTSGVYQFAFSPSQISTASLVTFLYCDSANNLYVGYTNGTGGHISIYNSSQVYQQDFTGSPGLALPASVAVDTSGNFWVVDGTNANVQKFNSSWAYQSTLSPTGSGFIAFTLPYGIWIDSSNNFYITDVANANVQKINSSAVYQSSFTGFTLNAPYSIAQDSNNNFIVGMGNTVNTSTVVLYNSSGVFQTTMAFNGSGNSQVASAEYMDIFVVSGITYLFISDTTNQRIDVFQNDDLNGFYAWCFTLVDASLNESQPSPLAQVYLVNQQAKLTINLNGLQQTANNWTTIRIYRTLSSLVPEVATANPTFNYVPGLDITINSGTSTYTVIDAIPDVQLYTNDYQMANITYEDGVLTALQPGWVPYFIMSWLGYVVGANWNDPSGNNYPRRIYWSAQTDNSLASSGNITTWNSDDYEDVGDDSTGDILGVFPGLQGRAYIWCQNATFLMLATGNAELPFEFIQISNQYGFYHHTVTEVPGGVMGRTKDGIALFNGAFFQILSHPLLRTLGTCLTPEADSAQFDYETQRYFIAVCDTTLTQSSTSFLYGTGTDADTSYGSIIQAFRNTVLIYDINTKSWETVRRTPIQIFSKFKDSFGKESLFGVGMASDVYFITQGNVAGCTYTQLVAAEYSNSDEQYGLNYPSELLPTSFEGKNVYIPYIVSGDGKTFSNVNFKTTIAEDGIQQSSPATFVLLEDNIPDINAISLVAIDNANGVAGSGSSTTSIVDPDNFFSANSVNGYGLSIFNPATMNDDGSTLSNLSNYVQYSNTDTLTVDLSGFRTSDQYVLQPYGWVQTRLVSGISLWDAVYQYLTPPYGYKNQEHRKKMFQYFFMKIQGYGPLRLDIFIDQTWTPTNGAVPNQTIYLTGNSQLNYSSMTELRIPLAGLTGYIMRVLITGIRGWTQFEIDDHLALWSWMEPYSAQ